MSIFVRPTAGNKYAVAYEFDAPWISRGARGPGRDHLWAADVRVRVTVWLSGYHGFRRQVVLAVATAGLGDVTPHDLRATHASWVADSHGVLVAARRLGHANASVTTRHYARAMDDRDAQVAKHLDKLGTAKPSGTQRARKTRKKGS